MWNGISRESILFCLFFGIFINDLDDGEERLFIKTVGGTILGVLYGQEFKTIFTNWKNDCNTVFLQSSVSSF